MSSPPHPVVDAPPRQGEDWFHSLAASTAGVVLVTDGTRVVFANPAAERLTGLALDRLLGTAPLDVVHPDDRRAARRRLAARLEGEAVEPAVTLRVQRPDGEVRWADLSACVIALEDGRPGVLYSGHDVTAHRRAVDELTATRARFERAQEAARTVTWEWELAGDRLTVDGPTELVFGAPAGAVEGTGRQLLGRIHPEDREGFLRAVERARDEGGPLVAEIRVILADGHIRWVSERARAIAGPDGATERFAGVATDVTERKRAELALEKERDRAQV
ncbi:MAG TPA: PAS domain S-box protein, partial [Thermoanaerobaculia bacterium]|nr:PAS domain S-box protein [Thermoanaerobaculia bacterium]